jgi:hypothetical protein
MSSDYTSSDSDTYDSDTSDDEQINNKNKFRLVLCHHYHDTLHGKPKDASVLTHYLVIETFNRFDISRMRKISDFYNMKYKEQSANKLKHRIVRNYNAIVTGDYVKPEIAQCIDLPTLECVCIKKTIWLRLVQRAWKRVFQERRSIIAKLSNPRTIGQRGIKHMSSPTLPGLRGMLV